VRGTRRERKRWEVGVPKGREAGEIRGNYVTLYNISQSKKSRREEVRKKGAGAGIASYGRREVWTPCPPPPPHKIGIMPLCGDALREGLRFSTYIQ